MLQNKFKIALLFLLFAATTTNAQLTIQSGASFTVQNGAQVTVQGSVTNAGNLTNDGLLKVQTHYSNSGTYSGTNTGVIEIYGAGNSDLNAGGSTIANLVINKTSATDVVKLGASITVNNSITHTNGVFTTDPIANPSFLISSPATATYSFAPGKEIIGSIRRTSWSTGTPRLFNGANMQVTTNAGIAPTEVTVTMIPQSAGGDPTQVEREVKRKFTFSQSGGSGFTADVRYPYIAGELNTNVEGNLVPWTLLAPEWNAKLSDVTRDAANDYVNTTGITAAQFSQEWKLADPNYIFNLSAYTKGGWNNPAGLMRTVLNTNGLLPLGQPYTNGPYLYAGNESVTSIPNANVVDWVLLELRKPATGVADDATVGTLIGRKAAFLLDDGRIVDLNGSSAAEMIISKQGTGNYIVVRHRNHLAIMSKSKASNVTGDFANDFSLLPNVYQKAGATSSPVSMLSTSAPGNAKYGMWPGDLNNSGNITPSDVSPINTAIGGPASGNTNVYNIRDVNLDRNVTPSDVSVVNSSISVFAQTSSGKQIIKSTPGTPSKTNGPVSHVPGENQ